jgi:hypothetical protein
MAQAPGTGGRAYAIRPCSHTSDSSTRLSPLTLHSSFPGPRARAPNAADIRNIGVPNLQFQQIETFPHSGTAVKPYPGKLFDLLSLAGLFPNCFAMSNCKFDTPPVYRFSKKQLQFFKTVFGIISSK